MLRSDRRFPESRHSSQEFEGLGTQAHSVIHSRRCPKIILALQLYYISLFRSGLFVLGCFQCVRSQHSDNFR